MDQNICHYIPFHKDMHAIHTIHFVFHHADDVYDFWEKGLLMSTKVVDLMSEAVLLYTFSFLGDRLLHETGEPKQLNSIHLIKNIWMIIIRLTISRWKS